MAKMVGVQGTLSGQEFPIEGNAILGRALNAEIRIDDLTVSRQHAEIVESAQGFLLTDSGSGNGTLLNGKRMTTPVPLRHGDQIQVGQHVFTFVLKEAAPEPEEPSTSIRFDGEINQATIVNTLDVRNTMMVSAPTRETDAQAVYEAHKRLKIVLDISNGIQTQFNLDTLLGEIMDRLFGVFPSADHGFIMLKEDDSDKLVPRVIKVRGDKQAPGQISLSSRIMNEAVDRRVAVLSDDAMGDQRFAQAASVFKFQIRSVMCAPLVAQDDLIGLIGIYTQRPDIKFTPADLELVTALANQAAFAIANANLHQKLLKRQRQERDLQLARQVQQSFLPDGVPDVDGASFAATYSSAQEVGGDFYDFIRTAPDRIAVVVGDVSGKGVPASLLMARMTSDVRFNALAEADPKTVLTRVNQRLADKPAGDAFVTLLYAEIDLSAKVIRVCNAAHPPPVLHNAAGEVRDLGGEIGFPIGVVPDYEYEQEEFPLNSGDVIAIFTDGITEAMDAEKQIFGDDRVHETMASAPPLVEDALQHMLARLKAHVGDTPQSDDLTLVCFGLE